MSMLGDSQVFAVGILSERKKRAVRIKRKRTHFIPPSNGNELGRLLWLVLGGEASDKEEAARFFDLPVKRLTMMIGNEAHRMPGEFEDTLFLKRLPEYRPDAWKEHGADFLESFKTFKTEWAAKRNKKKDKTLPPRGSVGDLLRHILWNGRPEPNESNIRRVLGFKSKAQIYELLNDERPTEKLSQLFGTKWPALFELHFFKGWNEVRESLLARASEREAKGSAASPVVRKPLPRKAEDLSTSPFQKAARYLTQVLDENGHAPAKDYRWTLEDQDVRDSWGCLLSGDETLPPRVWIAAIREVTSRCYCVNLDDPEDTAMEALTARSLIKQIKQTVKQAPTP